MPAWSTLFIPDGSSTSTSSDGSTKLPAMQTESLSDSLKCYVCRDFYTRPRILPCGHTFCSDCLARLRTSALEEFNKSRDRNAHRRGDCGFLTCPYPTCHYSMKLMNVGRWSLKNRAMACAVAMVKKQEREKQTSSAQTDIDLTRRLLAWPSLMFQSTQRLTSDTETDVTDGSTSSSTSTSLTAPSNPPVVQQVFMNSCFTTDIIHKRYYEVPSSPAAGVWKSYAFVVGMAVFDQLLQMTPEVYNLVD